MDLPDRVFTGRPGPNVAPESTYRLPASDHELDAAARDLLRTHPLAYGLPTASGRLEWYARCPTCEQWTGGGGCDVRQAAEAGDMERACKLHGEREWPAGTGKAITTFRGMTVDYSRVTFEYVDG